jgi:malate dehydrogenase (oxaloacetate-decarboxylating)
MATTSPGYSITVRAEAPSTIGATADLAAAVMAAGGSLTALDVLESGPDMIVVDVTCDATDAAHADEVTRSIEELPGVSVRKVSDRTFLLHLGGKIEVAPRCHSNTATTCPVPIRPGWPGYVRRSPRTRPMPAV